MKGTQAAVHIPRIKSVKTAVRIFYENNDLGTKEICELFGCGTSKASELKKLVQLRMAEEGRQMMARACVSTDEAYKAWGLDIQSIVARMQRAEKLGIEIS